jgi:hypothetical protein
MAGLTGCDPLPTVSDERPARGPTLLPPFGGSHSAVASATATDTPGPMVELIEIFLR